MLKSLISTPLALVASLVLVGIVTAKDETEEMIIEGDPLTVDMVNSAKIPTPAINLPQSLSVVSTDQIEQQSFRNFGDILRYTPGVSISQGEGHRDAVIIRGIQSTADFFIDGIRDDVQYYRPLYNVEQVEILRGPNALLFGRGGGGGVINRATKQPQLNQKITQLKSSADTFGAYSFASDINLAIKDNAAFRINAYYQEHKNHRDFFGGDSFAFNPALKLSFSSLTTGMFSYEYISDDRVVDRGVPSRNVSGDRNIPVSGFMDTFFGASNANITTLQAHILKAKIDHTFSDVLRGDITTLYAAYDKLYQNIYASDSVDVIRGRIPLVELDGYRDTTGRDNFITQANLISEFDTGPVGHTLLVGSEYGQQDTVNVRHDNVFANNGDDQLAIPFTDPLNIPSFNFTNEVRNRESHVEFISLYVKNKIDLTDQFKVILGLRYDNFDIDVFDKTEQNDGDDMGGHFRRTDEEITPRIGVIYKPAENVSLYASYSETFLPRSGDQFLTLNLDAQSTKPQFFENRELGLKWDIYPGLSLTTAVFELKRESFTSVDPNDPGQTIVIEGSKTTGLEVQLVGYLMDRWSISAGYSHLDGRVSRADGGGNDGNKTRQTPENMFSIWNTFQATSKLSFGLGVIYQGSFFVHEDNNVKVPDFTRVDVGVYYDLTDSLRIQANIENLFDEDYFPDAHSNNNISTGKSLNAHFSLVKYF